MFDGHPELHVAFGHMSGTLPVMLQQVHVMVPVPYAPLPPVLHFASELRDRRSGGRMRVRGRKSS